MDRVGPRTRPCTRLVLSGDGLGRRAGLGSVLSQGRSWGLSRVTVHLGPGERRTWAGSEVAVQAEEVSLVVRSPVDVADLDHLRHAGVSTTAVLPMDAATLPQLRDLADRVAAARPMRMVFTWPLHGAPPPTADEVRPVLDDALAPALDSGVPVGIKGLPGCALGPWVEHAWRTANRWYVDAEHQTDEALLFFPDVVRFAREDECRFCALQHQCDGAPEAWLARGLVGPLKAVAN